jgi:hypothetical protein
MSAPFDEPTDRLQLRTLADAQSEEEGRDRYKRLLVEVHEAVCLRRLDTAPRRTMRPDPDMEH